MLGAHNPKVRDSNLSPPPIRKRVCRYASQLFFDTSHSIAIIPHKPASSRTLSIGDNSIFADPLGQLAHYRPKLFAEGLILLGLRAIVMSGMMRISFTYSSPPRSGLVHLAINAASLMVKCSIPLLFLTGRATVSVGLPRS